MRHAFGLRDVQDQFLTGCLWLDRLDRSRDRLLRFDRHRNIERRRPERRRARTGHAGRSEEHTSELQSLMRISYAVFCLTQQQTTTHNTNSSGIYNRIGYSTTDANIEYNSPTHIPN